jgi:rhodanese-related sulfurtransferase
MTTLITRDELKAAIENDEVTVVDALPSAYYEQQHLPGAVNLFVDDAAEHAAAVLPDKHAAIVTYCSNAACPNSEGVARTLTRLGYTDVRKFREGIQDWVGAGLPIESGTRAVA